MKFGEVRRGKVSKGSKGSNFIVVSKRSNVRKVINVCR